MAIKSTEYLKGLHDFVLDKTGDKAEARLAVLLQVHGKYFFTAMALAEERHGINLMPPDCV
ncbi:MAG TPA: hypothetical protein VEA37_03380, partial [Flavobacterium sp.]|nr:hypothetical protein [Flavobacterium sp.]